MPDRSNQILTTADVAKLQNPGGAAAKIVDVLSQTNEILLDAPATPCNNGTTHIVTVTDSVPTPNFRMINQGSQVSKASFRQYTENAALLETWAQVDDELLMRADGKQGRQNVMMQHSRMKLEGLSQSMASNLFYADTGLEPGGFDGLAMRYNTLDKANFPEARNVLDAGGTGANLCSIWLIQWDQDACHLIYPKGTAAGIQHEVFQKQIIKDPTNNGQFSGTQVKFTYRGGIAVADWRRIVRIANIDAGSLDDMVTNGADTAAKQMLTRQMVRALSLLPSRHHGKTAFYMNSTPFTMLEIMAMEKSNVNLSYDTFAGGTEPITKFKGIPVRRVDALMVGEDQVTA